MPDYVSLEKIYLWYRNLTFPLRSVELISFLSSGHLVRISHKSLLISSLCLTIYYTLSKTPIQTVTPFGCGFGVLLVYHYVL